MTAIFSNNFFTDSVIHACLQQPYQIYRTIDQYLAADSTVKLAFVHHMNSFDPPIDEQQRSGLLKEGFRFSQEIGQCLPASRAVFAFDNEFHAYHYRMLNTHDSANMHWVTPIHSTVLPSQYQSHFLHWDFQFDYQLQPYKHTLAYKLQELRPYEPKQFYFDALLGLPRPHRDWIYHAATTSEHASKIFLSYMKNSYSDFDKCIWEPEICFRNQAISSCDMVDYLGTVISLSRIMPVSIYNQTAYSVIAETSADNNYSFFTEKIVKPLMSRRLFVVFSSRGFLANLKNMGFRTFDCVIDESYDAVEDSEQRYRLAWQQVELLCQQDQATVLAKIQPVVEHNFALAMNQDWNKVMVDQVRTALAKTFTKE